MLDFRAVRTALKSVSLRALEPRPPSLLGSDRKAPITACPNFVFCYYYYDAGHF